MHRTLILADHDPERLARLTILLTDEGWHVIGPARTARMALALAAQVPVAAAMIGQKLAGRRDGWELARELRERWGIRRLQMPDVS